jgi:hypothetical protein
MMAQKDYLLVVTDGLIVVDLDLPPGGGQYMVAIHVVGRDGGAENPQSGLAAAEAYAEAESPWGLEKIALVKNSANNALVGLFSESPANQGWASGPIDSMPHVSVRLRVFVKEWGWAHFAGVTVTRL